MNIMPHFPRIRIFVLICLVTLAWQFSGLCPPLLAQMTTATVSGTITDPQGKVVPGVDVQITNVNTGVVTDTRTNRSGLYVLAALPPGQYRIVVTKRGFKQIALTDLVLHVQDTISRNFTLALGATSESVSVTAEGTHINTMDGSVSTVVGRQFVKNMPLNGRSFQSLILLTPGVVVVPGALTGAKGEFSVNGQRTDTNYYTVDGVSANTGAFNIWEMGATPQETELGTTQSLVPLDDLQEFRINTSSYSAQYGRSPGAQISFETRSGTNEWHGALFDYFRNDVLDANNWFNDANALPKTAERQNDFGGVLGGPVRIPKVYNGKDKTFFFFSYEGLRLVVPQPGYSVPVPDLTLRKSTAAALQPLINAFPLPNGPEIGNGLALFTGTYSAPSNLDSYSIRIDHSFGPKLKVFGRYFDTPSSSQNRMPYSNFAILSYSALNVKGVTLGADTLFSQRTANQLRFDYTSNKSYTTGSMDNFGGATPLTAAQVFKGVALPKYYTFTSLLFLMPGQDLPEVSIGNGDSIPSNQWNVVDTLTSTFGSHTLTYGVDYRRQSALEATSQLSYFLFYASQSELQSNSALFADVNSSPTSPTGILTNFSAFLQDEWETTRRLHLSLGLRWDLNPVPTAEPHDPYTLNQITDLSTAHLAPLGTPPYQTDYRGFAPRFGIAYELRQNPGYETVFRGGFGVFYDMGSSNALYGSTGGLGVSSSAMDSNAPFPLPATDLGLPAPSVAPPYSGSINAPDPHLTLPYTLQWNVAIEQGLGSNQTFSISYVGSGGRKLLQSLVLNNVAAVTGNPDFGPNTSLNLVLNSGNSNYNALQLQFQRHLSHGLSALVSYTWSHSIDNLSTNGNYAAGIGYYSYLLRGDSDFDVRHNLQVAVTYNVPGNYSNSFAKAILEHWGLDLRQTGMSALPLDITAGNTVLPDGQQVNTRPDIVSGVPFYLHDPTAPGGRVINYNAFAQPKGQLGDAPRNFLRGFPVWETDLAIRREFPIREHLRLQFRAEAFNLLNHPNFSGIITNLQDPPILFGHATSTLNQSLGGLNSLYQIGGPRSLQLSLRLQF